MSNSTLERTISSFECLRVLHLRKLQIKFLPQSLGGLKHLRYLSISSKRIVTLPNPIRKLHNLQVLKLVICSKLKKLPRDIWRLVSLRHLVCRLCNSLTHIPPGLWQLENLMHLELTCFSLDDMPPGIGQLTSLRTLTNFIIGKESCISGLASDRLNELKSLVDLRHSLSIKFMGRARAIGEKIPTDVVKRMKHLLQLSVEFEYGNHEDDDTGADLIMLEALQPHQNIESLKIHNYSGSRFPSWLMVENLGFLLSKLDCLHIRDCHNCQKLPPLWKQTSLQSLVLRNLNFVENIHGLEGGYDIFMLPSNTPTDEHYFSSLKQLELEKISEKILKQILCPPHHLSPLCNLNDLTLVSVDGLVTMPEDVFKRLVSLQSLSIRSCRTLVSLSTCLTHLTSLQFLCIDNCPQLDLSNDEAMQFQAPGNLSTFRVLRLDKLMTLPVWLQHFSRTLKSIDIWDCPNFTTIPEWIGELISLNRLNIDGSPMLTSLPEGM